MTERERYPKLKLGENEKLNLGHFLRHGLKNFCSFSGFTQRLDSCTLESAAGPQPPLPQTTHESLLLPADGSRFVTTSRTDEATPANGNIVRVPIPLQPSLTDIRQIPNGRNLVHNERQFHIPLCFCSRACLRRTLGRTSR